MDNNLKNGTELTLTLQLAIDIMDSYPVKGNLKVKSREFKNALLNDLQKEYKRLYEKSPEFITNSMRIKERMIKQIADFDEADAILFSEFTDKYVKNIDVARKKGISFFNKLQQ